MEWTLGKNKVELQFTYAKFNSHNPNTLSIIEVGSKKANIYDIAFAL